MNHLVTLVLILAMSFGVVFAPDMSSASTSDMAVTQIDAADDTDYICGWCDPTLFADCLACEGGCPVPCSSNGTAGILPRTPSARLAMLFDAITLEGEPQILLGINPSPDPFPPKLPV